MSPQQKQTGSSEPDNSEGMTHQSGSKNSQQIRQETISIFREMCLLLEQKYKKNITQINLQTPLRDKLVEMAQEHKIPVSELLEDLLTEGIQKFEEEAGSGDELGLDV
jgi:hypothetical protein